MCISPYFVVNMHKMGKNWREICPSAVRCACARAYASAMTSHSTSTSLGRRATSTQLLAGKGSVK